MTNSVYFNPAVGGDGSTVTDDGNPVTGLANSGHRLRFVPALSQLVAVADFTVTNSATQVAAAAAQVALATTQANNSAASAVTALNAPGTTATSTSSITIPTSVPTSVSLTVQTGKIIVVGQWMVVTATSSTNNWFIGQVTGYTTGTGALVINAFYANGTGTFTAWSVSLSAPVLTTVNNAIQSKSGAYTVTAQDKGSIFKVSGTWTLATVASATLGAGHYFYIEKDDTGTITIDPNGSETINGLSSIGVGKGQRWMVYCDGSNLFAWRIGGIRPYLKVSDQKTSGTAGGSSVAADFTQTRTLNTVDTNTIPGASLASDTITLPAGIYLTRVRVPGHNVSGQKAALYNTSDSTYTIIGSSASDLGSGTNESFISGQFTITTSKNFKIRFYTTNAIATIGLGYAVGSGQVEVYTEAEFWKED